MPIPKELRGAAALLVLVFASAASGFQNFSPVPEQAQLELGTDGFFTNANYLNNGSRDPLLQGSYYDNFDFYFNGAYNFTHEWSLLATAQMAATRSNDGIAIRNDTSVTNVGFGVQYLKQFRGLSLAPEVFVTYPFNPVSTQSDMVLTGDGAMTASVLLNVLGKWKRWLRSYGYAGYTYRSEGLSSLVPLDFGTKVRLRHPWLGLEVQGYLTVVSDTGNPLVRTAVVDQVDGGSWRYYSVDPSIAIGEAFIEIPIHRSWLVRLEGDMTISGRNTAQGYGYLASLKYSFGGVQDDQDANQISEHEFRKQEKEQEQVEKFKPDIDKSDQSLFPQ